MQMLLQMNVRELLDANGCKGVRGIIHVGACECEELSFYTDVLGVQPDAVVWVEANRDVVNRMRVKHPTCNILHGVVADQDGAEVDFIETNDLQYSSILELHEHHPDVKETRRTRERTIRLDTLLRAFALSWNDIVRPNMMAVSVQGAELLALKGAGEWLNSIDIVYTGSYVKELYKGCVLLPELDAYLESRGFRRELAKMSPNGWGGALYVRLPSPSAVPVPKKRCGTIGMVVCEGLGNRLFQMSAAMSLARKHGCRFRLEGWDIPTRIHTERTYPELVTRFLTLPEYDHDEHRYIARYIEPSSDVTRASKALDRTIRDFVVSEGVDVLLRGSFQGHGGDNNNPTFQDVVALLRPEPPSVAARLDVLFPNGRAWLKNAMFVHVRLGDYVGHSELWVPAVVHGFYREAVEMLPNDVNVLLVVRDIQQAREMVPGIAKLSSRPGIRIFDDPDEQVCMYAMAACWRGGIVPNSAFSWWGAALNANPEKRIIMSGPWFNTLEREVEIHPPWATLWWTRT